MAAVNDLIQQIEDKNLRERLQQEVVHLSERKKFGFVFEDHIPECTPLYGVAIRRGSLVAVKGKDIREAYFVSSVSDRRASRAGSGVSGYCRSRPQALLPAGNPAKASPLAPEAP